MRLWGTTCFPQYKSFSDYPAALKLARLRLHLSVTPLAASARLERFSGLVIIRGDAGSLCAQHCTNRACVRRADGCPPGTAMCPWEPRSPRGEGTLQDSGSKERILSLSFSEYSQDSVILKYKTIRGSSVCRRLGKLWTQSDVATNGGGRCISSSVSPSCLPSCLLPSHGLDVNPDSATNSGKLLHLSGRQGPQLSGI